MNDLTEIALNALEREEAKDANNENDTTNDGADEKDTSNNADGGDNDADDEGDTESEQNTDDNDGGDSDDEKTDDADEKSDDDDSEDNDESESDDKKETKKKSDEMTDEEFEELAKKRGYSKNKTDDNADDEKKKAEEEAKRRMDAINAIPKPKELDADTWGAMPPMNKIIYSRLPFITVRGKDGDVKIKTPEQLPDDFEFASDKARAQYTNDIQAQENMAQQMANAIQGQARQQQVSAQQREQARAIIREVTDLQKTGDLPTPKSEPNTPEFNTAPAVAVINKVLNYQAQRAAQGVKLSVHDALVLYRAEHPNDFKKPENNTKAKGDEERKNVAKKVAGNNKSTNKTAAEESGDNKRKYYRPGMSTQDVLDRVLQDLD